MADPEGGPAATPPADAEALKAELEFWRTKAQAEGSRADSLQNELVVGSRRLASAEIDSLAARETAAEQQIAGFDAEITGYKREAAALRAEGKFEEAEDVSAKMASASARRERAVEAKAYFGQQREQAKTTPTDPVERFLAANPNFTDEERGWIRQNPRYATDRDFANRVNIAHRDQQNAGTALRTPEYFKALEEAGYRRTPPRATPSTTAAVTRVTEPEAEPGEGEEPGEGVSPYSVAAEPAEEPLVVPQPTQPARPRAPAAAAPSRTAPTAPARNAGRTRQLTADEAAVAESLSEYLPPEIQEGGLGSIYKAYADIKDNHPMAKRLRENWAAGA